MHFSDSEIEELISKYRERLKGIHIEPPSNCCTDVIKITKMDVRKFEEKICWLSAHMPCEHVKKYIKTSPYVR